MLKLLVISHSVRVKRAGDHLKLGSDGKFIKLTKILSESPKANMANQDLDKFMKQYETFGL